MKTTILSAFSASLVLSSSLIGEDQTKTEEELSPLVGTWAYIGGQPGPVSVVTVTINEDGTYHWVDISIDGGEDREVYKPTKIHHLRHRSGFIDLKTGEEEISKAVPKISAVSVTWKIFNGVLMWSIDMGEVGGEGLSFAPVGPAYISERAYAEEKQNKTQHHKSDRAGESED